jgi:hypothetical protein
MTLPVVKEIIRRPEAVTRDTFVADLSGKPAPSPR